MSDVVTVTGASGHIGSYVARALAEQGRRVRAVDIVNNNPIVRGLDIEHVVADVTDPEAISNAIKGSEVVYHLAAVIGLQEWAAPQMRAVNTTGVSNVVDACLRHGVRRMVHFTSIHAFRPLPEGQVVTETTELSNEAKVPAYDRSKAEGLLRVRDGVARGLDAVMLHPVGVLGPGDHRPSHIGSVLLRMAQQRMPAIVNGGFTWVDVRDVAAAALAAEQRGRKGENYILGGEWVSMRRMGAIAAETTRVRPPRVALPMWFMNCVAPIAGAASWLVRTPTPFNSAAMHAIQNHRHVSHAKAESELGHKPRPIAETITDTITWFRENGYFK